MPDYGYYKDVVLPTQVLWCALCTVPQQKINSIDTNS